ncbi:hypothetical protein SDC9_154681 [bioreactor metagenome]|uniref:Uncharacterized protein n=1 Tax=bioreactor metagenome TaxID=1076179 RepID=A0A645EZE5_9ZZZZ
MLAAGRFNGGQFSNHFRAWFTRTNIINPAQDDQNLRFKGQYVLLKPFDHFVHRITTAAKIPDRHPGITG